MKRRTIALLAAGALVLAGVALGGGVALGSGRGDSGDPNVAEKSAAHVASQAKTPKSLKCKAQACVAFGTDGSIYGTATRVVQVGHPMVGVYCVQLAPKLVVEEHTIALATINYTDSPNSYMLVQQSTETDSCEGAGFPNSVRFYTYAFSGGNWALADEAVNVIVP